MSEPKKLERPLHLDMPFGEALERYAQTRPEEVEPAPGQKRKNPRPKPGASSVTGGGKGAGGSKPEP